MGVSCDTLKTSVYSTRRRSGAGHPAMVRLIRLMGGFDRITSFVKFCSDNMYGLKDDYPPGGGYFVDQASLVCMLR